MKAVIAFLLSDSDCPGLVAQKAQDFLILKGKGEGTRVDLLGYSSQCKDSD